MSEQLPLTEHGLTYRAFRWADLPDAVRVYNREGESYGEFHPATEDETRQDFTMPTVDAERDHVVVEDASGALIAISTSEFEPQYSKSSADISVLPEYYGRGIHSRLITLSEAHVLARWHAETDGVRPLIMDRYTAPQVAESVQVFRDAGYEHIRTFYQMRIDLAEPVNPPSLPPGMEMRPVDLARDAHAIYQADDEAFRDHFNFEGSTYEEWEHLFVNTPNRDETLWMAAWDGDELAGVSINRPYGPEKPEWGWISVLGVRRPWRKRGVGTALLLHSFRAFQQRGLNIVGLGVDSDSPTNALVLYERAGMRPFFERHVYRKVLHAGSGG